MSVEAPTRLLDRLMWQRDEDGDWRHRLSSEWDGNHSGRTLWSRHELPTLETHYADVTAGVTWSHWGLGINVQTCHERPWIAEQKRSLPTRRTFVTVMFGPLYLSLHVVRPRHFDYDGPAS